MSDFTEKVRAMLDAKDGLVNVKRGNRFNDLSNRRFGFLTAISVVDRTQPKKTKWRCLCDCGNIIEVSASNLTNGHTKSCGCYKIKKAIESGTTHGLSKLKEYRSWSSMKARCYNVNNKRYNIYGGRGITVCDRWINNFQNFYIDMGPKQDGETLDRIDVNGIYEPSNCRWATAKEQQNNRRTNVRISIFGVDATLQYVGDCFCISPSTISYFIKRYGLELLEDKIKEKCGVSFDDRKIFFIDSIKSRVPKEQS